VEVAQGPGARVPYDRANHTRLVGRGEEVDQEQPIGYRHAANTGGIHQCARYLGSGCVAAGVRHPREPMSTLPAKGSLIETDAEAG
jgi:hypothetical protein